MDQHPFAAHLQSILTATVVALSFLVVCLVLTRRHWLDRRSLQHLRGISIRFDLHRLPLDRYRFEMERVGYHRCGSYELLDVYERMDRQARPDRFRALLLAIAERVAEEDDMLIVCID